MLPDPKVWTPEEIQAAFDAEIGSCGTLAHCVGAGFPSPDNNGGTVEIASGEFKPGTPQENLNEVRVLVFRPNGAIESRKLDPMEQGLALSACACAASGSGSGSG